MGATHHCRNIGQHENYLGLPCVDVAEELNARQAEVIFVLNNVRVPKEQARAEAAKKLLGEAYDAGIRLTHKEHCTKEFATDPCSCGVEQLRVRVKAALKRGEG